MDAAGARGGAGDAAGAAAEGGGGADADADHERKLTRAEQLLLWKQRRHGGGVKAPHTSDKQRSLQGLSSSQVNQRTGSGGSAKAHRAGTVPSPGAAAPSPVPSRGDSALSLRRGSSGRPRVSPSPSPHRGRAGAASDDEQVPSSREQSVEGVSSGVSSGGDRGVSRQTGSERAGEPVSAGCAPQQAASATPDSRRCSIHVAVEDDDDEVEWRVPVASDGPASGQDASAEDAHDGRIAPALEERVRACARKESRDRAAPCGQTVEEKKLSALAEDMCSDSASMQDTEAAGAQDGTHAHEREAKQTPGEPLGMGSTSASEQQLISAAAWCEAHPSQVHMSAQHPVGAEPGVEDVVSALLSSATPQEQDAEKDTGRMEVIAETWMEDFEVGWMLLLRVPLLVQPACRFLLTPPMPHARPLTRNSRLQEDEEEMTMEDVREKLFDTTNRLSRCTSLLQRMVEENAKLKQELTEAKVPCTISVIHPIAASPPRLCLRKRAHTEAHSDTHARRMRPNALHPKARSWSCSQRAK